MKHTVILFGAALLFCATHINADCWWTGCQLHTWAVVGCDHYGRVEVGRKDCRVGFLYNCCTPDAAGGGSGVGTVGSGSGSGSISTNELQQSNTGTGTNKNNRGLHADCWWTGCQLHTWAVVGCDHYGRKTINQQTCNGGMKYHCCPR